MGRKTRCCKLPKMQKLQVERLHTKRLTLVQKSKGKMDMIRSCSLIEKGEELYQISQDLTKKIQKGKYHYEILGFRNDPSKNDDLADHKMQGKYKRQALGAVKIMLDNFDCDHIVIFRSKGD